MALAGCLGDDLAASHTFSANPAPDELLVRAHDGEQPGRRSGPAADQPSVFAGIRPALDGGTRGGWDASNYGRPDPAPTPRRHRR